MRAVLTVVGAIESVNFETASGVPWTWSCTSCTTTCAIAAPNLFVAPPATACSGTVQLAVSTAPIGIGDGPGNYAVSLSCAWIVLASGPITVSFSEFRTEANVDYVKLYDGTASSAPLLGSFAGTAVPGPVTSTGGALTVVFTSAHSSLGVSTGFAATLASASSDSAAAEMKLIGTVPAALGDLRCIGRITRMCARLAALLLPTQFTVSADSCSDLSGQNFTGQLPDTISRLRQLSSMCARVAS
jgi:hypothetical protein